MTIRSAEMAPQDWAQKAPEYVMEARDMGITISPPTVQGSGLGFTIEETDVYFGLNAIKGIGATAAASVIAARKTGKFLDVMDFLARVDRRKVTTKIFNSLVEAGAFDRMGYTRADLLACTQDLYDYFKNSADHAERLVESAARKAENQEKDVRKAALEARIAEAKAIAKASKKNGQAIPLHAQAWINRDDRLREYKQRIGDQKPEDVLSSDELQEHEEALWLRKKPELALLEQPAVPQPTRSKQVRVTVQELMAQASMIGCYLGRHPARVIFPSAQPIAAVEDSDYAEIAGVVLEIKDTLTKRGDRMAFIKFGDGTAMCEGVVFPKTYAKLKASGELPSVGQIIWSRGRVETTDADVKMLVDELHTYIGEKK